METNEEPGAKILLEELGRDVESRCGLGTDPETYKKYYQTYLQAWGKDPKIYYIKEIDKNWQNILNYLRIWLKLILACLLIMIIIVNHFNFEYSNLIGSPDYIN